MAVFNGQKYLSQSINSILSQTFTDFDFLIVDDCSTDSSWDILSAYSDPRIKLIKNISNLGLAGALNKGLEISQSQYIARMDCDDISHPKRLDKQVAFMESHSDLAVCGTWVKAIGVKKNDIWKYPVNHDDIHCALLFNSALAHPSVMIRKSIIDKFCIRYDQSLRKSQDYDLWVRLCKSGQKLTNIPEVLLNYRCDVNRENNEQVYIASQIRKKQLNSLNIFPSEQEMNIHNAIAYQIPPKDLDFVFLAKKWLEKIYTSNQTAKVYDSSAITQCIGSRWLDLLMMSSKLGMPIWKNYIHSNLISDTVCSKVRLSKTDEIRLAIKCFLKK